MYRVIDGVTDLVSAPQPLHFLYSSKYGLCNKGIPLGQESLVYGSCFPELFMQFEINKSSVENRNKPGRNHQNSVLSTRLKSQVLSTSFMPQNSCILDQLQLEEKCAPSHQDWAVALGQECSSGKLVIRIQVPFGQRRPRAQTSYSPGKCFI